MKMEELIKDMFAREAERIAKEMPEEGGFEPICEGFDNPDEELVAKRFWLEAYPAPKGLENWEVRRGLALHASKIVCNGEECAVHVLLLSVTKEKMLKALQTNDAELLKECMYQTKNLSYHLIDLH